MYGKIFNRIYDSSIAEHYLTRFVFEDLLILCDKDGVVDMTHEAIARRTNVPLEIVRSAIEELERPDPKSRSTREEGARLKRLDDHRGWGWLIVNHDIYRAMTHDNQYREKTRERVSRFRAKQKESSPTPPKEEKTDTYAYAERNACNVTTTLHSVTQDTKHPQNLASSEIPSKEQAVAMTLTAAIPKDFAEYVYDDWAGRGGRDASNCPRQWLQYVTTRWNREKQDWKNGTHKGKRSTSGTNSKKCILDACLRPSGTDIAAIVARQNPGVR